MTKLNNHYNPNSVESQVKQFWDENDVYSEVKRQNKNNEELYFLDGPPFTSGRMHCGTAWGKVLKDVFLRYYRMNGYDVKARPGYDTHGLPIEVKVENRNNFDCKQDIVEYGVDKFIDECREYAFNQKAVMDEEFSDLGIWMDWDNPYLTMSKKYMNTVWSSFYELYNKGLISRQFDVLNTCPRCETTLSDSELEYDNRNVKAAYIGFKLKNKEGQLVTWTTTPWTVVGHQFVAVDKESTYVCVESQDSSYYVEKSCVDDFVNNVLSKSANEVSELDGSELVGLEYEHPLYSVVTGLPDQRYTVEYAEYVESEKTGLVHSAPGFGHEDYERGVELELEPFSPVDESGKFTEDAGNVFNNLYVHTEGSEEVLKYLDEVGCLIQTETYNHEYPHCPRCDTDVVFRSTKQWMVEVTEVKDKLEENIEKTEWYPSEARDERFRNTVQDAPNWNISRQRYWGTPLPVWKCDYCDSDTVISSSEELYDKSRDLESEPEDLHRPSVDNVVIECSECGSDSHRVEDVLDVWFDSSVASWGSLDVNPHQNPDPDSWPSDLIIEGHDQTRGWFLMQLYMGVALSDEPPYKDVLMHGFAMLDGEPMSKSRGHVLRPPKVVERHGRDSLRAYMLSNEQQENDVNMTSDMSGVAKMKQNLDIVWNVYRFGLMYMDIDQHKINKNLKTDAEDRSVLDNWVLSRLDKTIEDSTQAFENRQPHTALQSTLNFLIEDVSRYYIKTIRDRVWTKEDNIDKKSAYDTLGTVLYKCVKLLSPFVPHISEQLYKDLPTEHESGLSVHSENWPQTQDLQDPELEKDVNILRTVEEVTARARNKINRKQRWGLKQVYVETDNNKVKSVLSNYNKLLRNRTNTNNYKTVENFDLLDEVVEPKMDKFGPKFMQDAENVAERVRGREYSKLPLNLKVNNSDYKVTEDDVNVNEVLPENFVMAESDGFKLYADSELTDNMISKGLARDIVRQLQDVRSEIGLDVVDEVNLRFESDSPELSRAFEDNKEYIKRQVQVNKVIDSKTEHNKLVSIDEYEAEIGISKHK